ncbi:MAG: hypothetical protein U0168_21395 [Nannocystaceae bacterium]
MAPISPNNAGNIQTFLDTTAGVGSLDGQAVGGDGRVHYLCDSGNPETAGTGAALQDLVGEVSLQDAERKNAALLYHRWRRERRLHRLRQRPRRCSDALRPGDPGADVRSRFRRRGHDQPLRRSSSPRTEHGLLANDPASLQMALEGALQTVASCTFTLDQVPEDPSQIYVFFDLDPAGVPNDPSTADPPTPRPTRSRSTAPRAMRSRPAAWSTSTSSTAATCRPRADALLRRGR